MISANQGVVPAPFPESRNAPSRALMKKTGLQFDGVAAFCLLRRVGGSRRCGLDRHLEPWVHRPFNKLQPPVVSGAVSAQLGSSFVHRVFGRFVSALGLNPQSLVRAMFEFRCNPVESVSPRAPAWSVAKSLLQFATGGPPAADFLQCSTRWEHSHRKDCS